MRRPGRRLRRRARRGPAGRPDRRSPSRPRTTADGHGDGHGRRRRHGAHEAVDGHLAAGEADGLPGRLHAPARRRPRPSPARDVPVAFTIDGPDGQPVTAYDVEHEKRLHLIAVRRDLTGFQHVHPELGRRRHLADAARPDARATWRRLRRLQADRRRAASPSAPTSPCAGRLRARRRLRPASRGPRRSTATPSTLDGDLDAGADAAAHPRGHQRRRAGHRPRSPTSAPTATWSRCATGDLAYLHVHPDGDARRRRHRAGAGRRVRRRGAERGPLPALPRLPARRRGAHRRVHRATPRRGPSGMSTTDAPTSSSRSPG